MIGEDWRGSTEEERNAVLLRQVSDTVLVSSPSV